MTLDNTIIYIPSNSVQPAINAPRAVTTSHMVYPCAKGIMMEICKLKSDMNATTVLMFLSANITGSLRLRDLATPEIATLILVSANIELTTMLNMPPPLGYEPMAI